MLVFFKPTLEFPKGQLNPAAYNYMGYTGAVVAILAGVYCFFATFKYIPSLPKAGKGKMQGSKILDLYHNFFDMRLLFTTTML